MRSTRLLTGAVLSACALGLTSGTAYAGDVGAVGASPDPARPGSTVSLSTADCGNGRSARVDASALGGGTLVLTRGSGRGRLAARLAIRADVRPGTYGVGGACEGGAEIIGTVHVGSGDGGGDRRDRQRARAALPPLGRLTAAAGSAAASESAPTTEIAAGTGALLAAVAGGIGFLRRRRAAGRT
ncbi:hypothetical protein AB0C96_13065 [Streptomyces sp. NPDC048506]|uniref:hypothetical protein n=1 Tax=Streptomyces sp. NPDC048506 TaxID=3155028 RepID=UPI003441CA3D